MSAQAAVAPIAITRTLAPEEAARADFYALLARLLDAPPDAGLLAEFAAAGSIVGDPALARAWQDLVHASAAMDADAAAQEYEKLFVGMGKAQVSIYAGFYCGAPSIDHPRIRIQAELAALGLARNRRVTEPEDHFAGLFEVMRVLVAGGAGRPAASLADQKGFFEGYIKPGAAPFFEAMARGRDSNYYRHVAAMGAAFVALESESFLLE